MMLQIAILVLILIVTYLFIVPVNISFSLDRSFSVTTKIQFFPFKFRITRAKKEVERTTEIDLIRLLIDNYKIIHQVFIFFLTFTKSLFKKKYHYLEINLQGGLGSPDVTGIVMGIIEAVKPAFGNRISIVCFPDMMVQSITGNFSVQAVVRVYSVFTGALPLIFKLPLLKIIKIFIEIKKGEYYVRTT